MDFDSRLAKFRKKALWKQLEGYKHLLNQKEAELARISQEKNDTTIANGTILRIIKMINESISVENTEICDQLLPAKNALDGHEQSAPVFTKFLQKLSALLQGNKQVTFRPLSEAQVSAARQEERLASLQEALEEEKEKSLGLENALFSAQKTIAALKESNSSSQADTSSSPAKRARTDSAVESAIDDADEETKTRLRVMEAELEETRKVAQVRLGELDTIFAENQKLKSDLQHQQERLRRIPEEFWKDLPNIKFLNDEIHRYRHDLDRAHQEVKSLHRAAADSNYRHAKIVESLERDLREKYRGLDEFVRSTDGELARLRKDRDTMRQMYEQSNHLLGAAQKQLSVYESKLGANDSAFKALNDTISTLKSQIEQISKLNNPNAKVQEALDALRADEQIYIDELEALGKAFEQIQSENSGLLKRLSEKEDQISKLLGDKLKAEFSLSQVQKEAEMSSLRAQKIEDIAKHRVGESEAREVTLRKELGEVENKLNDRMAAADSYRTRLSDATGEIAHLRAKMDRLLGEINELRSQVPAASSATGKDQLSYEKRRLADELSIAKKKLEAYAASGIGIVKDLEEEVAIYKKLMKCNSCHTRDKNAVILKCMHCFCKQCLDVRLETRQRKCPNCGDAFGANDVRQIYL